MVEITTDIDDVAIVVLRGNVTMLWSDSPQFGFPRGHAPFRAGSGQSGCIPRFGVELAMKARPMLRP